ncbi:rRNA-processing protein FCF1 -like protein [Halotydeus destructor]|nr:rRNA-processing protein FCF1 -like protein [Halotydeus destructor]
MPKPKKPKLLSLKDDRVRNSQSVQAVEDRVKHRVLMKKKGSGASKVKPAVSQPIQHQQQLSSTAMYFRYNQQLGPPFQILCDTNFINFSIKNKLDIKRAMMDCLLAKCVPMVTDCVIAELQKLGAKYRVALKMVKDGFERLPCAHKGTYADDCLVNRVTQHKCYIVGTCDKGLKRRIRKIPGVPIMFILQRQYTIERMPDAYGCTK